VRALPPHEATLLVDLGIKVVDLEGRLPRQRGEFAEEELEACVRHRARLVDEDCDTRHVVIHSTGSPERILLVGADPGLIPVGAVGEPNELPEN